MLLILLLGACLKESYQLPIQVLKPVVNIFRSKVGWIKVGSVQVEVNPGFIDYSEKEGLSLLI